MVSGPQMLLTPHPHLKLVKDGRRSCLHRRTDSEPEDDSVQTSLSDRSPSGGGGVTGQKKPPDGGCEIPAAPPLLPQMNLSASLYAPLGAAAATSACTHPPTPTPTEWTRPDLVRPPTRSFTGRFLCLTTGEEEGGGGRPKTNKTHRPNPSVEGVGGWREKQEEERRGGGSNGWNESEREGVDR